MLTSSILILFQAKINRYYLPEYETEMTFASSNQMNMISTVEDNIPNICFNIFCYFSQVRVQYSKFCWQEFVKTSKISDSVTDFVFCKRTVYIRGMLKSSIVISLFICSLDNVDYSWHNQNSAKIENFNLVIEQFWVLIIYHFLFLSSAPPRNTICMYCASQWFFGSVIHLKKLAK